ncbi:hypothetical protein GLX_15300 [Komagataeibacter medellinensis NBRC 3288]|uniref:Uncharacterized protein n=1 Tax=Komagataeibacter medellinensis (strain NBRC 3288 / BCRC 11682 / LMG 1693 / Kondo 51) TaxID=634177 RepID=G2I745_KOMMN|nr:hypothetical protein GLX_15300 [Komagataeibacter medellinensis NBRC 3288]
MRRGKSHNPAPGRKMDHMGHTQHAHHGRAASRRSGGQPDLAGADRAVDGGGALSRPQAWQHGYEWAHGLGALRVADALKSYGYETHSEEARQFVAGANAALDEMEGRP